jgi:hypothetical protein
MTNQRILLVVILLLSASFFVLALTCDSCEVASLGGTWVNKGYNGLMFPYTGKVEIRESDKVIHVVHYAYDTDAEPEGVVVLAYEKKWVEWLSLECLTCYHIFYIDPWTGPYYGLVEINGANTVLEVQFSQSEYPDRIGNDYFMYANYHRQ